MFKIIITVTYLLFLPLFLHCQTADTAAQKISLLFIGDIMGHDTQIKAAEIPGTAKYDYNGIFDYLRDETGEPDLAVANLEVTLAGRPYVGYPQFSSPAALATACLNAGINCLVTANNHSVDRGMSGITGTIHRLDSIGMPHTGTFTTMAARDSLQPLILTANDISVAILNYTYGTNGLRVPQPAIVNMLSKELIIADIKKAREKKPDLLVLYLHWGTEYDTIPSRDQTELADCLLDQGADLIIGSHPHVIQKMMWYKNDSLKHGKAVAYSLGNFVSNQRKERTDGGSMIRLEMVKKEDSLEITEAGYYLTWVYTPIVNGIRKFYILPCSKFENDPGFFPLNDDYVQMKNFISISRRLLNRENLNINEYRYLDGRWTLNY